MSYALYAVPGLAQTDPYFRSRLVELARAYGYDPNAVAALISLESGFQPNTTNRQGYPAKGLLQWYEDFFPPVAKAAGMPVSWADLDKLTASEQLPLVMATLKLNGVKPASEPYEYLLAVFLPSQMGKPVATVIGRKDSTQRITPGSKLTLGQIYAANQVYDTNRDGVITIGDLEDKVNGLLTEASKHPGIVVTPVPAPTASAAWLVAVAGAFVFVALVSPR